MRFKYICAGLISTMVLTSCSSCGDRKGGSQRSHVMGTGETDDEPATPIPEKPLTLDRAECATLHPLEDAEKLACTWNALHDGCPAQEVALVEEKFKTATDEDIESLTRCQGLALWAAGRDDEGWKLLENVTIHSGARKFARPFDDAMVLAAKADVTSDAGLAKVVLWEEQIWSGSPLACRAAMAAASVLASSGSSLHARVAMANLALYPACRTEHIKSQTPDVLWNLQPLKLGEDEPETAATALATSLAIVGEFDSFDRSARGGLVQKLTFPGFEIESWDHTPQGDIVRFRFARMLKQTGGPYGTSVSCNKGEAVLLIEPTGRPFPLRVMGCMDLECILSKQTLYAAHADEEKSARCIAFAGVKPSPDPESLKPTCNVP